MPARERNPRLPGSSMTIAAIDSCQNNQRSSLEFGFPELTKMTGEVLERLGRFEVRSFMVIHNNPHGMRLH
ncbi:MAG: hypothetical protein AB1664_21595, partial [Thermodesulfobacteriota bacterium]